MSNTIELLEEIGKTASLRRASGEDLAKALEGMHASEALQDAAATGDWNHIRQELGTDKTKVPPPPQHVTQGTCEDEILEQDSENSKTSES